MYSMTERYSFFIGYIYIFFNKNTRIYVLICRNNEVDLGMKLMDFSTELGNIIYRRENLISLDINDISHTFFNI